ELVPRSTVHVLQVHPGRYGSEDVRRAFATGRSATGLAALRIPVSSRCARRAWSRGHRGGGCLSGSIVVGLRVHPKDDSAQPLQHPCPVKSLRSTLLTCS